MLTLTHLNTSDVQSKVNGITWINMDTDDNQIKCTNNKVLEAQGQMNGQPKKNNITSKFKNLFKTEFSRKELFLVIVLSIDSFCFGSVFSIQGAFFPTEVIQNFILHT